MPDPFDQMDQVHEKLLEKERGVAPSKTVFYDAHERPELTITAHADGVDVERDGEWALVHLKPHVLERLATMWEDNKEVWEPMARDLMEGVAP